MATNEINVTMRLTAAKGNFMLDKQASNVKADLGGAGGGGPGSISVAITEQTEDMSDYGYVWIRNLDATNFVQMGFSAATYVTRLDPAGPPHFINLDGSQTLYLKADTDVCEVEIYGLKK